MAKKIISPLPPAATGLDIETRQSLENAQFLARKILSISSVMSYVDHDNLCAHTHEDINWLVSDLAGELAHELMKVASSIDPETLTTRLRMV